MSCVSGNLYHSELTPSSRGIVLSGKRSYLMLAHGVARQMKEAGLFNDSRNALLDNRRDLM